MLLIFIAGKGAMLFTDYTDAHYWQLYKENARGYISPWYNKGLHIVDEGFIEELSRIEKSDSESTNTHNVIAIGSSLSAKEYDPEQIRLADGYDIYIFAAGGGSWRSNIVLDNLVRSVHPYTKSDIVKLEVSYSTFRDGEDKTTPEKVIGKWKAFCVADDLSVKRSPGAFGIIYNTSADLMRTDNVLGLVNSYFSADDRAAEIGPGNYRNNYFDYQNVSESISVNAASAEKIEKQILGLDKDTHVIAELSPIPPGLQETKNGSEYMEYVDKELIPWLDENGIRYIDYRRDFDNSDFADGAHLNYKAAKIYTKKLIVNLNYIIGRIKENGYRTSTAGSIQRCF